jgi:predicted transcriptional regulator
MNYKGFELDDVRTNYKLIWKKIKEKYPNADGNIYFAFKGEFASINDSSIIMLKKNHYVFMDSDAKKKAIAMLKSNKDVSESDIKKILADVNLNPDCRIEILWNQLDYDLIQNLQNDSLVDQNLTPKGSASIRIVLGIIGVKNID